MDEDAQGRFIAVTIDRVTGCHQLLNVASLPYRQCLNLFGWQAPPKSIELRLYCVHPPRQTELI